jgi:hypothetical protein
MDLAKLKKQVENGEVRTTAEFKRRLLLMFANAVMYNSTGHDVNIYAKEMAHDSMSLLNVRCSISLYSCTADLLLGGHGSQWQCDQHSGSCENATRRPWCRIWGQYKSLLDC